jgi:HlyD family secretion protein
MFSNTRKRRAPYLFVGAIAIAVVGASFLFWGVSAEPKPTTAAAESTAAPTEVGALGRIEPQSEIINIGSGIADRLESLLVDRGTVVKKGQILGYLQSYALEVAQRNQIAAELDNAKQKLATAITLDQEKIANAEIKLRGVNEVSPLKIAAQQANIEGMEAALDNNRAIEKSYSQLLSSNAGTQRIYDNQKTLVLQSVASLAAAKAQLAELKQQFATDLADAQSQETLARATLARDQSDLAFAPLEKQLELADVRVHRTTIYAPIDGRILNIYVRPGELVSSSPLMAMGDTTKMRVVAEVYETDLPKIRIGQKATVSSGTLKTPITGHVVEIGWMIYKNDVLNVDPAARTDARVAEVRIELDDAELTQRLTNHTVDVRIDTGDAPQERKVSRINPSQ